MDRWKKVPGMQKWAGYYDGKHVATLLGDPQGYTSVQVWVDGGNGFQKVSAILGRHPEGLKEWKQFAHFAYKALVSKLAKASEGEGR